MHAKEEEKKSNPGDVLNEWNDKTPKPLMVLILKGRGAEETFGFCSHCTEAAKVSSK
jgi:hypothetical protein